MMLERKVEAFLRRNQFKIENNGVLVGVSGGPDSLALLHFLWCMREKWKLNIVAAHVDHMFRGKESEEEAIFVKEFCEKRNIPVEMVQLNIPNYMEESGLSSQIAAREARYSFFKNMLTKHNLSLLALGHHGDDQIETILMRLTRGSTGKARTGIPFTRDFHGRLIVRPFLCLNRDEIEQYCLLHQLDPRRDPSNEKEVYSRNRFRKHVLPFLKKENQHAHEHFQRFSEDLASDEILLQELAEKRMEEVIKRKSAEQVIIYIDALRLMPMPLQRRGIQLILNYLYHIRPASLSAIHIEQIFSIINSPQPSGSLHFPNGLKVVKSYLECSFQFFSMESSDEFSFEKLTEGEMILPNGGILKMEFVSDENMEAKGPFATIIHIAKDCLPLIVRTRKNGDRMTMKGMAGTKKLKNLFIDEKIPLQERDRWPVITDCFDQIIWIPGLRRANIYLKKEAIEQRNFLLTYTSNDLLGGTKKDEK